MTQQRAPVVAAPSLPDQQTTTLANKPDSILHQSLNGRDFPDDLDAPSSQQQEPTLAFSVLSHFSRITQGARTAAQSAAHSVLSHPLARPVLRSIPEPITQFANAPGELTQQAKWADEAGVSGFDSSRLYLAKWARIVAQEGEKARRAEIVYSGEVEEDSDTGGAFVLLATQYKIVKPTVTRASNQPISLSEWDAWLDESGKLQLVDVDVNKRIFQRGLSPEARKEVWPFLLKLFPWDSTAEEREAIREKKRVAYHKLKANWLANDRLKTTDEWAEEDHRIDIDCRRTDRTHPMFQGSANKAADAIPSETAHSPSTFHVRKTHEILLTYVFASADRRNYCQGMSDLLSPIYVVLDGDEELSYWCFEYLMERMRDNFARDQSGMKRQLTELQALIALMDGALHKDLEEKSSLNLFFCFRWLLCSFKREFSFEHTLQLWEVLWTDYRGTHFHLFVALAILEQQRDIVMKYLHEFDEILKFMSDLSHTLDVQKLMNEAEVLYLTFRKVLETNFRRRAEERSRADGEGLRRRANNSSSGSSTPPRPVTFEIDESLSALID